MPFGSPFFFLFSTSKPRWGFFLLVWYDSHTSPPMRCFLWKWATPHQGLTSIRNIFQLKMKEREIVFWWSKIGGEGDCWFGGCKNCKDALSPSTFYWIQTRKCVMNYEQEGIHWRIKIQLSSFADINWGTASKYLIVRQWHCDGCLRDKYSAVGPPGTAGGQRDYKSTASKSFAQKACEVILTLAPSSKIWKVYSTLSQKESNFAQVRSEGQIE